MIDLLQNDLIVDLFAGGGGASQGIYAATGRHPDIAINHDLDAVAAHARNHPETKHFCQNIWAVEPKSACGDRSVGLLWASPDCFPHGTLVTTPAGHTPIEDIRQGDLVLTHKGRFRAVSSTLTRAAETVIVRGHGHYGLVTTPNHQFYSKRVTTRFPSARKENGCRQGPKRTLVENPYWPAAQEMVGKLWATPRAFPAASIPICKGTEFSEGFFYFLGRWIGDGSINKGDVEICCGNEELPNFLEDMKLRPLLNADGNPIPYRIVDHGSSKLVIWGCQALADWLIDQVGTGCEHKKLPMWSLAMQANWRLELLRGYVDADGHDGALRVETKSVSKALSLGIRLLATTLGHAPSFYLAEGKDGRIEGRSFKGLDCYRVVWTRDLKHATTYQDTIHAFSPVRETTPGGMRVVVSLQVEEDESFVADGIVVHNCRHFSRAAGGRPKWKSVRSLPGVVLTWATRVRPKIIVVENVSELLSWGPLLPDGTPCPKRIGRSFKMWVGRLRGLGYRVQFRNLCAADFGAPTIRTRLVVVAVKDGGEITWPTPTHSKAPSLFESRWRSAAECIDWSDEGQSIFERKRPLKEATLRRIADGIVKFILKNPKPFLIRSGAETEGDVIPHISSFYGTGKATSVQQPLGTVTAQGYHQALVTGHLMPVTHQDKRPGGVRGSALDVPVPTVTAAKRGEACLIASYIAQHNGGAVGRSTFEPLSTITGRGTQQAFVEAVMSDEDAGKAARVAAFIMAYYSSGGQGHRADSPLGAVTSKGRFAVVTVEGIDLPIIDIRMRMLRPAELARAQGFPLDYDLTDGGRLTKTTQIRLIGNSVCPDLAAAIIRANVRSVPDVPDMANETMAA